MKKFLSAVLVFLLTFCLVLPSLAGAPFRGWNKTDKYQYVSFGTYPQATVDHIENEGTKQETKVYAEDDPVVWMVLDTFEDEDIAYLLARYVMDAHRIAEGPDSHHSELVLDLYDSLLYQYMNEEMLPRMFTESEQSVLDDSMPKLFLPPNTDFIGVYGWPKNIHEGYSEGRMCDCTPYAQSLGVYRGPNAGKYGATFWVHRLNKITTGVNQKCQIVGFDGHLSWAGTTRDNVGIRPAIRVRMSKVTFSGGSGTKDDPYILSVLSDGGSD